MKTLRKNRKGFTIVELVIVIAVIAILAAVLIPTFSGVVQRANESAALQEARTALSNVLPMSVTGEITEGTRFYIFDKDNKAETKKINYGFTFEGQTLKGVKEADYKIDHTSIKQIVMKEAPTETLIAKMVSAMFKTENDTNMAFDASKSTLTFTKADTTTYTIEILKNADLSDDMVVLFANGNAPAVTESAVTEPAVTEPAVTEPEGAGGA